MTKKENWEGDKKREKLFIDQSLSVQDNKECCMIMAEFGMKRYL